MAVVLPTFAELQLAAQAEIQAKNSELTDFSEGSALDAVSAMGALMADETILLGLLRFSELFFATAKGEALERLAKDRLDLDKPAAQAAAVPMTLTRGDTTTADTVPVGTEFSGEVNGDTVTFALDGDMLFGIGDASGEGRATCTVTGRSGNVDADVLTTLSSFTGSSDFTCTNGVRAVGGAEEATDPEFRAYIAAYWDGLVRGTVAALKAGAFTVGGVTFATVDESTAPSAMGGYVSLYVGDPDARSNAVMLANVDREMVNWRAAGILVQPIAAVREEFAVSITLYVKAGADTVAIETAARAAVLAYQAGLDPGATWYRSQAHHACIGVSGDCVGADVTTPATDQAPAAPQNAMRTPTGLLSFTVVEV